MSNPQVLIIYMAGPLFSMADRAHNQALATALEALNPNLQCVLPQVHADQFLPDTQAMVADCFEQIARCDMVLACLDGADVDSGTALELGYAKAHGKRILGYRTDFRGGEVDGVNAMIRFTCNHYVTFNAQGVATAADLARALLSAIGDEA